MEKKPVQKKLFSNWKWVLAGAAALFVVAFAASPSLQAVAQDFLNLFRVKRFTAVSVDPQRIAQLQADKVDIQNLLGNSVEVLKNPGEPKLVASAAEAAQASGLNVRMPAQAPEGLGQPEIRVQGEGTVRFTADTAKLQDIVDAFGLPDVKIPAQLNGAVVTITKPAMVAINYQGAKSSLLLLQSHNPEIVLPDGVDMAQLGEIALRVAGMSADEAHRLAQTIDWHSTLLVPIPANAATFREVDVRGTTGLLITTDGSSTLTELKGGSTVTTHSQGPSSVLMWSEGDAVYALSGTGNIGNVTLADIANSLQ